MGYLDAFLFLRSLNASLIRIAGEKCVINRDRGGKNVLIMRLFSIREVITSDGERFFSVVGYPRVA